MDLRQELPSTGAMAPEEPKNSLYDAPRIAGLYIDKFFSQQDNRSLLLSDSAMWVRPST